jgi:hypothetical protein
MRASLARRRCGPKRPEKEPRNQAQRGDDAGRFGPRRSRPLVRGGCHRRLNGQLTSAVFAAPGYAPAAVLAAPEHSAAVLAALAYSPASAPGNPTVPGRT